MAHAVLPVDWHCLSCEPMIGTESFSQNNQLCTDTQLFDITYSAHAQSLLQSLSMYYYCSLEYDK